MTFGEKSMIKIAPSTNPCDETKLLDYALKLQASGADYMHLDVMDGQFVTNKALNLSIAKTLSFGCLLPIDVHLMTVDPIEHIEDYIKIRPNYITTHLESYTSQEEVLKAYNLLKEHGILFGLSIKPTTIVEALVPYLNIVNLVLPMSVEPGKSGQEFMESTLKKYEFLDNYRKEHGLNYKIEADGGVNHTNIAELKQRGVDIAVVGNAMFNSPNKKIYIDKLKK